MLLTLNTISDDSDDKVGVEFNYYNPWVNEKEKEVNIGFDMFTITGVLFL